MNKKQKKNLIRIIITAFLLLIIKLLNVEDNKVLFLLYLIPYIIIGYDIIRKAFKGILNKEVFDENFLMAIATIGSMIQLEFSESVMVMLLYQIGEWFQSYAVGKSRKNIAKLMDIRPDYANIIKDDEIVKVDPNKVEIGETIMVLVGEKVPLDGIVIQGNSSLNTIALTGESKPRSVKENDEVISGCINMTSPIKIKTTKKFAESTVSKILNLVENATSNKSKSEDFISKFAHYYTPIVCYSALALAIIPPLFIKLVLGGPLDFMTWINRSLTFLVISCPCALVISIPLSFFAGIGGASAAGVLIKGSNYLESLAKTKYIAFDKTGTVTLGIFEVTSIHNSGFTKQQLLEYAAYAEVYSPHPIGKSIIKEYGKPIDKSRITSVSEIHGKGIEAIVDNKKILIGNEKLMNDNNISIIPCDDEGTICHIAIDKEYKGHLHIGDKIKPTSIETIKQLRQIGVNNIYMLTGDEEKIANSISSKLGMDKVFYGLLPQDKVEVMQEIIKNKSVKDKVVFVGDGLNDAPVISIVDVGIAMGSYGSDAAIEAADIVLMDDDPLKVVKAIKIAKKCMTIVNENIYFAIGVKVISLILSAFGIANMWIAVFADVGVMIIAVLNSIRAMFMRNV